MQLLDHDCNAGIQLWRHLPTPCIPRSHRHTVQHSQRDNIHHYQVMTVITLWSYWWSHDTITTSFLVVWWRWRLTHWWWYTTVIITAFVITVITSMINSDYYILDSYALSCSHHALPSFKSPLPSSMTQFTTPLTALPVSDPQIRINPPLAPSLITFVVTQSYSDTLTLSHHCKPKCTFQHCFTKHQCDCDCARFTCLWRELTTTVSLTWTSFCTLCYGFLATVDLEGFYFLDNSINA